MMSAKALVIGIVGAGCIAAAGVGGFLAVREAASTASAQSTPVPGTAVEPALSPAIPDAQTSPLERPAGPRVAEAPRPPATTQPPQPAARRDSEPVTRTPADAGGTTPVAVPAPPPVALPEPVAVEAAGGSTPAVETPAEEAPAPVVEAPRVLFEELMVPENAVIGIRLDNEVSSATARIEDRVRARVIRDVTVDGRVAVPSGSTIEGLVTAVERGGRFRERSRLGVRFTTVVLPDDTRVPIQTETIFRMGDAPGGEATSKIGAGAVVGTILGAVIGGKKGATIGGAAGAAGGTAAVMAGGPNDVVLAAGTSLTVRLTDEVAVPVPSAR
jgi:hypothetical protein